MKETPITIIQTADQPLASKIKKIDGRRDFDFLVGRWMVRNRRLSRRLEKCREWQEFTAMNECRHLLGGLANLDRYEAIFPNGKPIEGLTLRCFNPATNTWSIYWNDNWTCQLQPPVLGGFTGDRGEFYGDDVFNGKPIRVRYIWLKVGRDAARWEQAFSVDGGKRWETNWIMEFSRTTGKARSDGRQGKNRARPHN